MDTLEIIQPNDDPFIEAVIKTVLEEHGVNKPGTAYFDESLRNMHAAYSIPKSVYFIARIDGVIVGGSGIFPTNGLPDDTCELVKMYLLPSARGKGLGKRLINKCIDFAARNGYKKIYLETMAELSNAIGMYEKSGFHMINGPLGNSGHFACTIRMLKHI